MIDPHNAAFLLIDMQRGFIDESSSLCIAGAAATVPACARALAAARKLHMPIYHVNRRYAADGANVEAVRFERWLAGGRPLSPAAPETLEPPSELAPAPDEPVVIKPKFSAFFDTDLDVVLRARGIRSVVLAGTTTPNCIRATCYDALSLGYNVAVVEDATSSRTAAAQEANIADMAYIGAYIMTVDELTSCGLANMPDIEQHARTAGAQLTEAKLQAV